MPTYQYSCTQCGHFLEAVQSFSDDSLTVCPECDGRLRKVFGAVGVVFKGSGFYRTDSRGAEKSAQKSADSSSSSAKETSSSSATSTGTSSTSTGSSGTSSPSGSSTSSGGGSGSS